MMSKMILLLLLSMCSLPSQAECQKNRVKIQVLGSGGPELTDNRASTSYLIWLDNKGMVLLDTGAGSALNYEKSGASLNDLNFFLFSHLHVDHSADFPAFIKGFYFSQRDKNIQVFGPSGNQWMPSMTDFVAGLFGEEGIYRYLSEYLLIDQKSRYKIKARNVNFKQHSLQKISQNADLTLLAVPVHHGPLPALAWRINIAGCSLVFSGDMSNHFNTLGILAKEADILIAHNAIPEGAQGIARQLHMPPSVIGKIAHQSKVKKLILSHLMTRTLAQKKQTIHLIKAYYHGPVFFANDMDLFTPE